MSDVRRPKPTKLKDTVQSSGDAGFNVKQFFGKSANLVPVHQSQSPAAENDPTMKIHLVDTVVPSGVKTQEFTKTLPIPTTSARALGQTNAGGTSSSKNSNAPSSTKKKSSAKWLDPALANQSPKPVATPKNESATVGFVLLATACFAVAAYMVLPSGAPATIANSKLSPQQLQERIEFHQKTTGWKLNSERIETQIDNHYQAPKIAYDAKKMKPADMMNGLPLQGEVNTAAPNRDRSMPVNSSYADARIMYGLQEEQDRVETDKRLKAEYEREFIENAARDGYAVKIDRFGNVKAQKMSPDQYQGHSPTQSSEQSFEESSESYEEH